MGRHYEYSQKGSEVHQTQYYPEAGAMRVDGALFYLLSDHLGSTSIVTDAAGNKLSEARYDAWGKTRYIAGGIPTDLRYTGQRLSEDLGLYDYRARWYDPLLGRFLMEDTIIAPQGVMSLDRYSYARNAPVLFVDPSGHRTCTAKQAATGDETCYQNYPKEPEVLLTHKGDEAYTEDGKKFYRARGGDEIYQLFLEYQSNCGWWNSGCSEPFGLEEFLGLYILFESSSRIYLANALATVIAQNIFVGGNNPAACFPYNTCYNAVFNFIAANIDRSSALLQGPTNEANQKHAIYNPDLGSPDDVRGLISSLGKKALSPDTVVIWGDRNNGPVIWGNVSDWGRTLMNQGFEQGVIYGTDPHLIYYFVNNAIYATVNQMKWWKAFGVDMTMAKAGETLP